MKKIMVVLAAVAFGVVAQAATVSWTASSVPLAGSQVTAVGADVMTAFLINADVTGWSTAADAFAKIAGGSTDGVLMQTGSATQGKKTDVVKFVADGANITGTWAENQVLNSYLLIVDASDIADAAHYMSLADENGSGNTKFSTALEASPAFSGSSGAWTAVPEPTSGLLLLIGIAGMALKRKHA